MKHRGKRIDTGEWVYGFLISDNEIRVYEEGKSVGFYTHEDFEVDPKTVGMCTGMKDKNGKDIFEGDIIRYYQPYAKITDEHIVQWDNKFAGFGLFEKGGEWCKESDWMKIQSLEIIGTIHDRD